MTCMKCGRETAEEEVFCEECLAEAAEYPIDPNAVVIIPRRDAAEPVKKTVRRRTVPLDEQVKSLKKRVRWLTVSLILCIALLLGAVYPVIGFFTSERYRPGQNYTPIVTTPPTSSETFAPTEAAVSQP